VCFCSSSCPFFFSLSLSLSPLLFSFCFCDRLFFSFLFLSHASFSLFSSFFSSHTQVETSFSLFFSLFIHEWQVQKWLFRDGRRRAKQKRRTTSFPSSYMRGFFCVCVSVLLLVYAFFLYAHICLIVFLAGTT